jgi:hypothetical protein
MTMALNFSLIKIKATQEFLLWNHCWYIGKADYIKQILRESFLILDLEYKYFHNSLNSRLRKYRTLGF